MYESCLECMKSLHSTLRAQAVQFVFVLCHSDPSLHVCCFPVLRYFMEEERILGHLPSGVPNEAKAKKVTPLEQYLTDVISKREGDSQVPDLSFLRKLNERLSSKLEALHLNLVDDRVHNVHPAAAAPIAEPTDQGNFQYLLIFCACRTVTDTFTS